MRKLKTRDVPEFCRTLKMIGIKEEIKQIAMKPISAKEAMSEGFDLVYSIFDRATEKDAEAYLYAFLAGPFEMTAEEVADMDLTDFIASIKQLAEGNDLVGFFKSAAASMK